MTIKTGKVRQRRFASGELVTSNGLYRDHWGSELMLFQGDVFPHHPEMGSTRWTYAGPSVGGGLEPWQPKSNPEQPWL